MSKNAIGIALIVIAAIGGGILGSSSDFGESISPGAAGLLSLLLIAAVVAFCVWALSSNKGGAQGDAAALADARAMTAPEGKARIYVTRRGFVAGLQGLNVTLDAHAKGQIKSGQMLMADVSPGTHHIHAVTAKEKLARPAELEIEVGAGAVVVIGATLEMGALKGSVKLTRLDAAKAHADVHATKLILWEVIPHG